MAGRPAKGTAGLASLSRKQLEGDLMIEIGVRVFDEPITPENHKTRVAELVNAGKYRIEKVVVRSDMAADGFPDGFDEFPKCSQGRHGTIEKVDLFVARGKDGNPRRYKHHVHEVTRRGKPQKVLQPIGDNLLKCGNRDKDYATREKEPRTILSNPNGLILFTARALGFLEYARLLEQPIKNLVHDVTRDPHDAVELPPAVPPARRRHDIEVFEPHVQRVPANGSAPDAIEAFFANAISAGGLVVQALLGLDGKAAKEGQPLLRLVMDGLHRHAVDHGPHPALARVLEHALPAMDRMLVDLGYRVRREPPCSQHPEERLFLEKKLEEKPIEVKVRTNRRKNQ